MTSTALRPRSRPSSAICGARSRPPRSSPWPGPVTDGVADLTNGHWRMSQKALVTLGFRKVALINDYAALAYAAQALNEHDLVPVGPEGVAAGTIAVIGAGTGLGVSAVVADRRSKAVAVTEGGHVAFAPGDAVEAEILHHLSSRFERVSLKRILSGPGLSNLHWALGRIHGRDDALIAPSDLVGAALTDKDAARLETLDRFCRIYGACAGDMALALGAVALIAIADAGAGAEEAGAFPAPTPRDLAASRGRSEPRPRRRRPRRPRRPPQEPSALRRGRFRGRSAPAPARTAGSGAAVSCDPLR